MKLLIAPWHQDSTKENGDKQQVPILWFWYFPVFVFNTSFLMHNGGGAVIVMETGHDGD